MGGGIANLKIMHTSPLTIAHYIFGPPLRGNVGENQRGAPTCRRNLCSYSGYQKYLYL